MMALVSRSAELLLTTAIPFVAVIACGTDHARSSQGSSGTSATVSSVNRDVEGCYALAMGPAYATKVLAELAKPPKFEYPRSIELSRIKPPSPGDGEWVTFPENSLNAALGKAAWHQQADGTVVLNYFYIDWGYDAVLTPVDGDTLTGVGRVSGEVWERLAAHRIPCPATNSR